MHTTLQLFETISRFIQLAFCGECMCLYGTAAIFFCSLHTPAHGLLFSFIIRPNRFELKTATNKT